MTQAVRSSSPALSHEGRTRGPCTWDLPLHSRRFFFLKNDDETTTRHDDGDEEEKFNDDSTTMAPCYCGDLAADMDVVIFGCAFGVVTDGW